MCLYKGISDVVDHVVLDAGLPPGDAVSFEAATSFVRRSVSWTDAAFPLRIWHGCGCARSPNSPGPGCGPDLAGARPANATGELAFFRYYAPTPVSLDRLVTVAGRRWRVEESFAQGKNLAGLDEPQVRMWTSWHRWSLLVMVAYAFLAVFWSRELACHRPGSALVALSCNEIARLLHALFAAVHSLEHVLGWSVFRRVHQGRAQRCHYRRRALLESWQNGSATVVLVSLAEGECWIPETV